MALQILMFSSQNHFRLVIVLEKVIKSKLIELKSWEM